MQRGHVGVWGGETAGGEEECMREGEKEMSKEKAALGRVGKVPTAEGGKDKISFPG